MCALDDPAPEQDGRSKESVPPASDSTIRKWRSTVRRCKQRISLELPGHLEGPPCGLKVNPLNNSIGWLSEVLRSFRQAEPSVSLGVPAIGMSIALEIGKTQS